MRFVELATGRVDLQRGLLEGTEAARSLTPRECGLLGYLAARPGHVVPRSELLREVFGVSERVRSRTVDTTMARLRQKVERDPTRPAHLRTVVGRGVQFVPLVPEEATGALTIGRWRFAPQSGTLSDDRGITHALTAQQVALVTRLGAARGEVVAAADLTAALGSNRRALKTAMYRLRALVEPDPRAPVHLLTAPGRGYRLVAHRPGAVPLRADRPLFGREGIVRTLLEHLEQGPVQLVGPGGIGKSRIAREVAERLPDADEVAWAELGTARDADAAREVLAAALGVEPTALEARLGAFSGLLVLEDAEPGHATETWSRGRVLLTSHRPLPRTQALRVDVPPLGPEDAAALFTHEAGAPPPTAPEGPPLDVLLAARRARAGVVTSEPSIEATWTGLSERARSVWAQASVLIGSFDLEAAETVFPTSGWVVDPLEELVEAAIVTVARTAAGMRYRLHSSLRAFGASRLSDAEREGVEARLVLWARHLARRHEVWIGVGVHDSDLPNLRQAHRIAPLDPDITRMLVWPQQQLYDADAALALCDRVLEHDADPKLLVERAGVLIGRGDLDEADATLDRIPADASPTVLAGREWLRSRIANHRGGSSAGREPIERGLALSGVDPLMRQCLLLMLADLATARQDPDTAEALAIEALALPGNPGQARLRLAHAAELRGDLDEAAAHLQSILELPIDPAVTANTRRMLGQVLWRAGRVHEAEQMLTRTLARERTLGQVYSLGGALAAMVRLRAHLDDVPGVLALCDEALDRASGEALFALFHGWSAGAAARLGDLERARHHAATYREWAPPDAATSGFFAVLCPLWDPDAPAIDGPDTVDGALARAWVTAAR